MSRRPRRFRRKPPPPGAAARIAQGLRRRTARHARAVPGDRADADAGPPRRRRDASAVPRLRHVGSLHGSRRGDRPVPRPAGASPSWILARGRVRPLGAAPRQRAGPRADASARGPAGPRQRHPDALRAPRRGHARDGIHRAPRGPAGRARAGRGRARPRDHSRQHQPSRGRADDHRPQVPREDQRQHRQLRGRLLDRGGGREDDAGRPLGRGHGHGPLDRARTSTRRASGSCATRRCRSARCRSTRRSRRSAARPRS